MESILAAISFVAQQTAPAQFINVVADTATTAPAPATTAPAPVIASSALSSRGTHLTITLMGIGLCVLACWIIRRATHRDKLTLRDTPGRQNSLTILHLLLLLAGFVLVSSGSLHLSLMMFGRADLAHKLGETGAQFSADEQEVLAKARLLGSMLAMPVVLAAALTMAHWTFRHGIRRGLGLTARHWVCDLGRAAIGVMAVYPVCVGLLALMTWLLPERWQQLHTVLQFVVSPGTSAGWVALATLMAVVMAPVLEEVLYRGFLQSALRRWLHKPWPAIAISSVLFALVHLGDVGFEALPALAVLAAALGYNYERTGRLLPNILMHALFNAIMLLTTLI